MRANRFALTIAIAVLPTLASAEEPGGAAGVAPAIAEEDKSRFDRMTDRVAAQMDQGRNQDPLKYISGDMTGIVKDLSAYMTDKPVQTKQENVVLRLEALIKELEKQCKGAGGASPNPSKPLARSQIAGGPGGQGDMIDPRQGDKQWAALPPKQREQILQSRTEGFPPGYEAILQSYYRRLSQEQVTPDGVGIGPGADTGAGATNGAVPAAASPAASPFPSVTPGPATKPAAP